MVTPGGDFLKNLYFFIKLIFLYRIKLLKILYYMSFYILSSLSYIKNNEYKFGFSSKSEKELLYQYEKNKRLIPNPFILK